MIVAISETGLKIEGSLRGNYGNFSVDECVERLHKTIKFWTEESWSCAVTYTVSGSTIHTYSSRYSFQATSRKGDPPIWILGSVLADPMSGSLFLLKILSNLWLMWKAYRLNKNI